MKRPLFVDVHCVLRISCTLLAVLLWWGTGHASQSSRCIDYLYVEANEGDSSGGHVALRFGDETFHFQHETPGILRVRRIASAAFDHAYAMLGNRTIRENRISVTEDTYDLLRDAFNRLFLVQEAQLEIRDSLRRDAALFELLLRQRRVGSSGGNTAPMPLKGLAYFLPDGFPHEGGAPDTRDAAVRSPALLSLLNRIHAAHGNQFVAERIDRARTTLREMELQAAAPSVTAISPDLYPPLISSASSRYEDTLLALYALEVLQAAPPLRPGTFRTSDNAAFRLAPPDSLALQAFAKRLESELADLAASSRTDWGFPFIVGMARLAAIEASLSSGRLVFLDITPAAEQLAPRDDAALRQYLPAMAREKEEVFLLRRGEFLTGGRTREADYAALERTGNLLLDIDQARVSGSALRKDAATSFPSREVRLNVPMPGNGNTADLARQLAAAQAVERDYAAALDRLYAYDLVRRNCVTEIFAVINRALAQQAPAGTGSLASDSTAAERVESEQRLGGYIDASHGLSFIPFVSAREVATSYTLAGSRERQSYRTLRLTEMNRRESPLTVALRESNTITSTIYRPTPDDSKFLFFTDDTLLLRPVFGAFNLLVGFGESLAGIAIMPVTGPDRFISGTKGMLFSLPELVFVNIRKGSMAYVEPESSR